MSADIWNTRRKQLEKAVVEAALDLAAHTGSAAFSLPVRGTTPELEVTLAAQAPAEHQQRAPDENARLIGMAHIICNEAGIPAGEIIGRLVRLSQRGDAEVPRPISTAPHDGTEVLAWSITGKTWHQVYWKTQENGDWAWVPPFFPRWACRWNEAYHQGQAEFSHWMPLPATPQTAPSQANSEGDAK